MSNLIKFFQEKGLSTLPDNAQWQNRFSIESQSSNRLYTIAQRKSDGVWGCSCPSWITRRRCKHLDSVLPLLTAAEKETNKQIGQ